MGDFSEGTGVLGGGPLANNGGVRDWYKYGQNGMRGYLCNRAREESDPPPGSEPTFADLLSPLCGHRRPVVPSCTYMAVPIVNADDAMSCQFEIGGNL